MMEHLAAAPSDWIVRWTHLLPAQGSVLDVACGTGRHVRWFAARGHPVLGIDRAQVALDAWADLRRPGSGQRARSICADIEGDPWPCAHGGVPQTFDAVIVTNYLWRPLLPTLMRSVAAGGVLLYETFALGQGTLGKPSRPEFLLQRGELLQACQGLRVVAYEDGVCTAPTRFVQRICAVRERAPDGALAGDSGMPRHYPL